MGKANGGRKILRCRVRTSDQEDLFPPRRPPRSRRHRLERLPSAVTCPRRAERRPKQSKSTRTDARWKSAEDCHVSAAHDNVRHCPACEILSKYACFTETQSVTFNPLTRKQLRQR